MPCMKCANGKYKYGAAGNCQFDTLADCKAAAAAIHIHEPKAMQADYSCEDCHDEFLANYKEPNV